MKTFFQASIYTVFGLYLSALSLIQIKVLATTLNVELFGVYIAVTGISMFILELSKLGIPTIFQRYIPFMETKDEHHLIGRLNFTLITLYFGIFLFALIIVFTLSKIFYSHNFFKTFPLGLLGYGFYTLNSLVSVSLISAGRLIRGISLQTLPPTIFTIILILLRPTLTLEKVFFSLFLTNLIFFTLFIFFIDLKFCWFNFNYNGFWDFFRYSSLSGILFPVFQYFDSLVVTIYLPFQVIGLYGLARRVEHFLARFFYLPLDIIAPGIAKRSLNPVESQTHIRKLFWVYIWVITLTLVLFSQILERVILILSSEKYLNSVNFLRFLLIHIFLLGFMGISGTILRSLGDMRTVFKVDLTRNLLFLLLTFPLTKIFQTYGIITSILLSTLFATIYILTKTQKIIKINPLNLLLVIIVMFLGVFIIPRGWFLELLDSLFGGSLKIPVFP